MVNCVAIAIIILYTVIVLTKLCIVELSHTLIHIYMSGFITIIILLTFYM